MRLRYLTWSAALCGLSLTTLCPDAFAQQLGRPRDVVISAERLFGIYGVSRNYEGVDNDLDPDDFSAGFLMQGAHLSPVTVPRVAIDVFIIERLSLGGSLGLYSNDINNGTGAVFSPRVGYSFAFNQNFGFWPKAGFTYYSLNNPDRHHFSLSLEGAFVFMPNPAVGFTATPFFDLGLSGEDETGPNDIDYVDRVGGVVLGMFARF